MVLLGTIAFAQASFAYSACLMERGRLAGSIGSFEPQPCDDGMPAVKAWTKYANRCLAHCTADLQAAGDPVALVRSPAREPVLSLVILVPLPLARAGLEASPPGAPPLRILLHSFLI